MQRKMRENQAAQALQLQLKCVGSNDKKFQNAKASSLMWTI